MVQLSSYFSLDAASILHNTQDFLGQTALILASGNGHDAIVRSLLSRNDVDIYAEDSLGQTALIYALHGGYEAVVDLLLSRLGNDIDIDSQDS